jgi:hypothetical protein
VHLAAELPRQFSPEGSARSRISERSALRETQLTGRHPIAATRPARYVGDASLSRIAADRRWLWRHFGLSNRQRGRR